MCPNEPRQEPAQAMHFFERLSGLCKGKMVAGLCWTPGHTEVSGNEKTNLLAKKVATTLFVGQELLCGIKMTTYKKERQR